MQCFYRLSAEKLYQRQQVEADGSYNTPLLPSLSLNVEMLWQSPPPDIFQVTEMVRAQIGS
jgi:hypothetical protein